MTPGILFEKTWKTLTRKYGFKRSHVSEYDISHDIHEDVYVYLYFIKLKMIIQGKIAKL
jgi:hypothetical protein